MKNTSGKGVKRVFLCTGPIGLVKSAQKIIKRNLSIYKESSIATINNFIVFDTGLRKFTNNRFQNVIKCYDALQAAIFIYNKTRMLLGLFKFFHHLVGCIVSVSYTHLTLPTSDLV